MDKKILSKDQLSGIIIPKNSTIILCNKHVSDLIKNNKVDIDEYNAIFINDSLSDDELIQLKDDKPFEIQFQMIYYNFRKDGDYFMIQPKQPKKIKGKRRKEREEIKERLMSKFPTWFEGRSDKQINELITYFKLTKKPDEEFPEVCVAYESELKFLSEEMEKSYNRLLGKVKKDEN